MTREEARAEAEKMCKENLLALCIRSCWNCNASHDRLREADFVILCVWCGHYYYKGIDISPDEVLK